MFAITKNIGIQTLEKNLFFPFCRYIKYLTAAKRHKHAAVYELSNKYSTPKTKFIKKLPQINNGFFFKKNIPTPIISEIIPKICAIINFAVTNYF